MKKLYLIGFLCTGSLLIQKNLIAQTDSLEDFMQKKSYWQFGVDYLSDNVYMGRKDSVKIPYISPTIGYYNKSGLFITGSLSYLPSSGNSHIDLFYLEGGYSFAIHNFQGQIEADKFFYSSKSTNVRSEVKGSVATQLSYNFGFIKPTVQGGVSFGTATDYALALGLEHTFYLADDKLDITPGVLANLSTQNFYGSYYNKRRYTGKRKRKATGILYYDISADVSNVAKFKLLDYEFSVPINYSIGKFVFDFTPTLAIPMNPAQVSLHFKPSTGTPFSRTFTEKLSNAFFFQAGLTYQL